MIRRFAILMLAGLAACDRGEDDAATGAPAPAPSAAPQVTKVDAGRMLQEKAAAGLRAILPDPDDARFADIRSGTAGAVCGKVDTEQPDGKRSGFRPFVVTPEGVGIISLTPTVMLNDPEDLFPDYYIRWCATPAELATLEVGTEINTAAPMTEVPADLPELGKLPEPGETPSAHPAEVAAAPPTPPAPAASSSDLESFSKAVIRGQPAKRESR